MKIEIDDKSINGLQRESIKEIIARCKGAHFTNVKIRINGKFEEHEADFIKHMKIVE